MERLKVPGPRVLPLGLAVATGLLFAAAAPPWDLWPLALVGLIPLYFAVRDASVWRAAALGFGAGLVLHVAAQSWWPSLLGRFTDLSPLASFGIAAVLIAVDAAAMSAWAGLSRLLVQRGRLPWLVVAPLSMGIVESLWPSFFEWHLGVALWRAWPLVQVAEFGGGAAVTALLVLGNVVIAETALAVRGRRAPARSALLGAGVAALVLALGLARARQVGALQAEAPQLEVGILQPNFGPLTRAERSRQAHHLVAALREGTRELAAQGAELVIWPESAWPLFWDRRLQREYREGHPWSLRKRAPSDVLVGALTHPFGSDRLYNSALLLRATGEVAGTYDKRTLVPFSEYVPFGADHPDWKEAVENAIPERPEITPGEKAVVLADGSVRLGALLCSEDLSARAALAQARDGANLLVSMANDGWFRTSGAVQQHLALAALRAVETRRNLVRVTTHGISAHIDALGRVRLKGPVVELGPGERKPPTLLRARVPLVTTPSLGALTLPYFPHACAAGLALAYAFGHWQRSRRSAPRRARKRR